jgi:hypothetical protein
MFNVILTYGCLSGPYTNEQPTEDDNVLVKTYVWAYIGFNINFPTVHYSVFVSPWMSQLEANDGLVW